MYWGGHWQWYFKLDSYIGWTWIVSSLLTLEPIFFLSVASFLAINYQNTILLTSQQFSCVEILLKPPINLIYLLNFLLIFEEMHKYKEMFVHIGGFGETDV